MSLNILDFLLLNINLYLWNCSMISAVQVLALTFSQSQSFLRINDEFSCVVNYGDTDDDDDWASSVLSCEGLSIGAGWCRSIVRRAPLSRRIFGRVGTVSRQLGRCVYRSRWGPSSNWIWVGPVVRAVVGWALSGLSTWSGGLGDGRSLSTLCGA